MVWLYSWVLWLACSRSFIWLVILVSFSKWSHSQCRFLDEIEFNVFIELDGLPSLKINIITLCLPILDEFLVLVWGSMVEHDIVIWWWHVIVIGLFIVLWVSITLMMGSYGPCLRVGYLCLMVMTSFGWLDSWSLMLDVLCLILHVPFRHVLRLVWWIDAFLDLDCWFGYFSCLKSLMFLWD